MTGDGVNDALALKDADIGVAMGSGAPATRAVAQLVLLDGSFATLPGVVAEGRRVIANIERVANLFVTKTVYAMLLAIAVGDRPVAVPVPAAAPHDRQQRSRSASPAFFLALAPNTRRYDARASCARVLRFAIPAGIVAARGDVRRRTRIARYGRRPHARRGAHDGDARAARRRAVGARAPGPADHAGPRRCWSRRWSGSFVLILALPGVPRLLRAADPARGRAASRGRASSVGRVALLEIGWRSPSRVSPDRSARGGSRGDRPRARRRGRARANPYA